MPEITTPPPDTTPPAEGMSSGNNNNSSAGGSNNSGSNGSNRNRGRNNRNVSYISNHQKDWKGDSEEVGLVLWIKAEKLSNQTSVDGLIEKLEGNVKKTFDYYEDVICILSDEDPVPKLEKEKDSMG